MTQGIEAAKARIRPGDRFISSERTRERLGGISKMTEWRRRQTDPDFPQPIAVNGNVNQYIEREVDDYQVVLVARSAAGLGRRVVRRRAAAAPPASA
jgi:hypothetical protein